jgi:flagellar hook-length control protein FliK
MADFSISNAVAPVGGGGAAPSSRPGDSARDKFDEHLQRADQPSAPQSAKRPVARRAESPSGKTAPEKSSDSSAVAAPADASQDDQSTVDGSDSQHPVSTKQDDANGDQHDDETTPDAIPVAPITVASIEAVAAPVDEITITSTDSPEPQAERQPDAGKSETDTTNAALQQAVTSQTSDATTTKTVASTEPNDVSGQATTQAETPVQLFPGLAPPSVQTLEDVVKPNKQAPVQTAADTKPAEPAAIAQTAAAQATVAANAAQPIVTIVSSAHVAQGESTPDSHRVEDKANDSRGNEKVPASVVTPTIQAALTATAAPPSQPLDLGSDSGRDVKRSDADRDPVAPTDATPKPPPTATTDGPTNSRFQINLAGRNELRSDGASEVERVRFVQRVARAFQAADDQGGQVRLRLNPPELGALKLEITMKGGVMTAKLEAETPAARSMLLDNLPALRERLAERNVKIEKFDVDVMDRQPGGMPDTPDGSDRGARPPRPFLGGQSHDEPTEVTAIGGRIFVDSGQLNVVI